MGVSLTPGVRKTRINLGSMDANRTRSPAGEAIDMLVYASFWRDDDDQPTETAYGSKRLDEPTRKYTALVVTDADGRAIWRRPPFDATVGVSDRRVGLPGRREARRTVEIPGNRRRIHVVQALVPESGAKIRAG
jgi:hypothetical protein